MFGKIHTPKELKLLGLLAAFLALAVAAWVLFAPEYSAWRYFRLNRELTALKRENRRLTEENAALREEINRLENDDDYLEKVAREEYGLLKKNEILYRFDKK